MFWLNQINTDSVKGIEGNFFNKAKNELQQLISDGEAREYRKLFGTEKPADTYDGAHREGSQY